MLLKVCQILVSGSARMRRIELKAGENLKVVRQTVNNHNPQRMTEGLHFNIGFGFAC